MKRRAMTLLEVLLSIGISGIVLTVVTTLLAALWRADVQMREDIDARQSLARLEIALRRDAREATGGEVDASGSLMLAMDVAEVGRLQDGPRRVTYSVEDSRVVRVVTAAEQIEHRESFRLPRDCVVRFGEEDQIVRMALAAAAAAPSDRVPGLPASIELVIAPPEDQP